MMRRRLLPAALVLLASVAMAADVGKWSFDDGEGTVAKDSSGNDRHGSITGASWVVETSGTALAFEGPNYEGPARPPGTFVRIAGSETLNPTKRVTVAARVFPTFKPVAWGAIVEKGIGYGSSYRLLMLRSGKVRAAIGNEHVSVDSPEEIPLDTWTSLEMRFNGKKLTLLIDGKAVAEAAAESKGLASDQPIEIGKRFTGRIDDVRIAY